MIKRLVEESRGSEDGGPFSQKKMLPRIFLWTFGASSFPTSHMSNIVRTTTNNFRYFHFRHLMKILVLILTCHQTDFHLFSLMFAYFDLFFLKLSKA